MAPLSWPGPLLLKGAALAAWGPRQGVGKLGAGRASTLSSFMEFLLCGTSCVSHRSSVHPRHNPAT